MNCQARHYLNNVDWAVKLHMKSLYFRNDLNQMEYLTMCIKEGLRLHCPVAIVSRQVKKEFNIGDRVLPKDTTLQVNHPT